MNSISIDERTPVLALHCSLGSGAQWRSLAKAMPEREVIAPDLLGYGNAPAPEVDDCFSLDNEVDAIEKQLIGRLGIRQAVHLVGHSYGGAVAWRFALRNPSRVKTLTLFEPVTLWLVRQHPAAAPFRALARLTASDLEVGLTTQAARRFIDFWSGSGAFASLAADRQAALAERMGKVRLDFAACLGEPFSLPAPGHLNMPALLMSSIGALEALRANMRILRSVLNECSTAEVAGGHMAPVENRAQVDAIISCFIKNSEHQTAAREELFA